MEQLYGRAGAVRRKQGCSTSRGLVRSQSRPSRGGVNGYDRARHRRVRRKKRCSSRGRPVLLETTRTDKRPSTSDASANARRRRGPMAEATRSPPLRQTTSIRRFDGRGWTAAERDRAQRRDVPARHRLRAARASRSTRSRRHGMFSIGAWKSDARADGVPKTRREPACAAIKGRFGPRRTTAAGAR